MAAEDTQKHLGFVAQGTMVKETEVTERAGVEELGTSGLRSTGGYIIDDVLHKLQGRRGKEFYREMFDNTSVLASSHFRIKGLIRHVKGRVATPEGMETDEQAIFWQQWTKDMFDDMDHGLDRTISQSLSMLTYGFAPMEKVFKVRKGDTSDIKTKSKYNDGLFGLRKIALRSQDTVEKWLFDPDSGEVSAMVQNDNYSSRADHNTFITIPVNKLMNFRPDEFKDNPEGRSMLRSSVVDYHFHKRLREQEAIGASRDLTGMVHLEVPQRLLMKDASDADKALLSGLKKMAQRIQVDESYCAITPPELDTEGKPTGFKFELMASPGSRSIDMRQIIRDYQQLLAICFFSEFMLLGSQGTGAKAQHESSFDSFKAALEFILEEIASVITRDCIWQLMEMNGVPREYWPRYLFPSLSKPDLARIGAFVKELTLAGLITPNRSLEEHMLQIAELPVEQPEDDDPIFDLTTPTPTNAQDKSLGVLGKDQVDLILRINEALNTKKIEFSVAATLLGAALGVDAPTAQQYLGEAKSEEGEPGPGALNIKDENADNR